MDAIVKKIVLKVRKGDHNAFGELVELYKDRVFALTYRMLGNRQEAEDVAQEAFIRAYTNIDRYQIDRKFSTWLYAFTYNHCVNYVNRNTAKKIEKKSVDTEILEYKHYDPDKDDKEISQLRVDKLKGALDLISPDEKMILLLKYQDSLSIKELSDILDIGESAVKMRLKRAKEKLINVYNE